MRMHTETIEMKILQNVWIAARKSRSLADAVEINKPYAITGKDFKVRKKNIAVNTLKI